MNRTLLLALCGLLVVVIGVYFVAAGPEKPIAEQDSTAIKELVQHYSGLVEGDVNASIDSSQLLVKQGDQRQVYPLPMDEFFVSIAPYLEETHPCTVHNLTACQGELANTAFQVRIVNGGGELIVDQTMQSQANGFIDLWLPRNQTYQVHIAYDGRAAVSELSTYEGDPTCVTTMQLS